MSDQASTSSLEASSRAARGDDPIRVGLACVHGVGNTFRQKPIAADVAFGLAEDFDRLDWLVVLDEPPRRYMTDVPRCRRIALLTEPPEIKFYRRGYLEQFGTVISPMRLSGYSGTLVRTQGGLPWFYGTEDLETLRALTPPPKTNGVSVVITRKTKTPLHRARLRFVEQLGHRLGDRLHVFGNGFRPVENKREAIDPFKYHLSLENNSHENFWTEKVADPYLGWSLPLYSGCPNLADYFPDGSFVRLDLNDIAGSIDKVVRCLDEDPYDERLDAIAVARRRLIEEHNIFALLRRIVLALTPGAQGARLSQPIEMRSNGSFDVAGQLSRRIKAALRGK